jgi:uncharacterized protein (TIGR04222 family)
MNNDQKALLDRLDRFSPDDPASSFPFSSKLAKENGWTLDHARRVVVEYKRFAFLAMTADHVASPSDQVDQAWHLHITYTRSYWEEFCGKVLGKPLHHEPSKGGRPEDHKYRELYIRTLKGYRDAFGEEPPADIWPPVDIRFGEDTRFVRVNRARHWIIPKPRRLLRSIRFAPLTAPLLALASCGSAAVAMVNPMDLRGPDFLKFFAVLSLATFGTGGLIRWWLRGPGPSSVDLRQTDLTPYEAAMVAGGSVQVIASALAVLVKRNAIEVLLPTSLGGGTFIVRSPPDDQAHPIEHAVWNTVHEFGPSSLASIEDESTTWMEPLRTDLEARGLVLSNRASNRIRKTGMVVALAAPLVGSIKVFVGLHRDKPVVFLVMGTIATVLLALFLFRKYPLRTRAGDAVLKQMRRQNADLRTKFDYTSGRLESGPELVLPMAVALFGAEALIHAGQPQMATDLVATLSPPLLRTTQGLDNSSGSSGCSMSSCSSGSSCGGGGGGSGCGGCGGGGD